MLVLSRQKNESIFIGDDHIEIMIVDVYRGKVKLGIKAPEKTPVHRKEIYERIKRNKQGSQV
ncbi:carbon storage regulator CsrA [Planctomycetota bacterium]